MAFVPWKDRVTATPHRYKLTEVGADTYDLEAVPGAVSEAGTPVNATNLDRLIQRDGDDIKDTVVAFTEAGARANIATGESTATLFGKVKKYFTDLKTHAFTTPSATLNEGTTSVPSDKLLYDTAGAISNPSMVVNGDFIRNDSGTASFTTPVAESINKWGLGFTGTTGSYNATTRTLKSDTFETSGKFALLYQYVDSPARLNGKVVTLSGKAASTTGNFLLQLWKTIGGTTTELARTTIDRTLSKSVSVTIPSGTFAAGDTLRVIFQTYGETALDYIKLEIGSLATAYTPEQALVSTNSPEIISAIKTFSVSPLVPTTPSGASAAVNKSYADSLRTVYDRVIRTQTEFDALIDSATWLDAKSVAFVGAFTLSTANNSGIKIPATVKQIHGFNSAKITITNFVYSVDTAKGGLWYDTAPTTRDYSIRDLEVSCDGGGIGFVNCTNVTNCTGTGTGTGTSGFGFYNCTNLTNCVGTGTGTGTSGFGFYNCTNLTNCVGTGTGTGTAGFGFRSCTNLTNCVGTGTGTGTGGEGYGFGYCTNVTNCTGTGTGTYGYGFSGINYAVNCKDGGSSTDMWYGTNKNIDVDTCCKTPVTANNTTLNT